MGSYNDRVVIDTYEEHRSIYTVGDKLGISPHKAWRVLKRNNIKLRDKTDTTNKYKINENYFEIIDTELKAYFLGLIYSDGNVYGNTCSISLQEEDSYILRKLSDDIFIERRKLGYIKARSETHKNQNKLYFTNKKIIQDLQKLGVFPTKTFLITFPTDIVEKNLIKHFIRGYFDGDGCIYENKTRFRFSITGNEQFLQGLQNELNNNGIKSTIRKCSNKSKVLRLEIGDKVNIKRVMDYMYNDSNIFFKRKREKFIKMDKITNWDKLKTPGYSKQPGVTFDKRRNKWYANKKYQGEKYWLGSYNTEEDAILAVKNFTP